MKSPVIDVVGLAYEYPGAIEKAIQGISFQVQKGEIFGFLGPSGAGKSTTQKILIRLLRRYQGRVEIFNRNLGDMDHEYYQRIGVGFELPNHYNKLTAFENLQLFSSFYRNPCHDPLALLERVGLKEDAHLRVEQFSKGMKMRLNFIRALLHNPDLIFLDEPTSGLDPSNARIVKDMILEEKNKGKTLFLTTHNMHDADELCDRVAFITDGKITTVEVPQNLKRSFGRRTVQLQYEDANGKILSEEFEMDQLSTSEAFMNRIKLNKLVSIHSKEASLDEVFIKLTGKKLLSPDENSKK